MNNTSEKITSDLQLAFDVGHSSIGWAVLQALSGQSPTLLGCGSVIFPADDCLASQRRGFRRQRRHIRSTRQRIARLKVLLQHLGVLTDEQLQTVSSSSPWFLAARVLAGGPLLGWPELWDVLRWYAHNRGYDGNKRWSKNGSEVPINDLNEASLEDLLSSEDLSEDQKGDVKKVKEAKKLIRDHGTKSMAETFCKELGLDPLSETSSSTVRFKGLNAAFPRGIVETEVRTILEKHFNHLPSVSLALIQTLFKDWKAIAVPSLKLPLRYQEGLLFGQLVPRFNNRIISTCPITFERTYQRIFAETADVDQAKADAKKLSKVPTRNCAEFYRFRWAMQMANIQIAIDSTRQTRPLSIEERAALNEKMRERGYLTPKELKDTVRALTGQASDNLGQMLLHPDAQEALLLDPVQKLITSDELAPFFSALPVQLQKRFQGKIRKGQPITLGQIREQLIALPVDPAAFDLALIQRLDTANTRKGKKTDPLTREAILSKKHTCKLLDGRAAYHRDILRQAYDEVLLGLHPKEKDGCLYRDEAIRTAHLQREIDEQTNNHLVRHRLRILERLHDDILREYAGENRNLVARITIEVNRDLKEMSGMTAKQVAQDMGQRLSNFKNVALKLEKDLAGKDIHIGPGLIRKARIAEDVGWTCPYTDWKYDAYALLNRTVDKDHIIPRSLRPSDSLDSQVITLSAINKWKGQRTAIQFVEQEGGKPVPGMSNIFVKTLTNFQKDVDGLETFKGHDDDKRRKKNRQRLLRIKDYVEKEFTPGDLTKTSQLVRLGAQSLQKAYLEIEEPPVITSLPGSVTGAVRKSWNLLGCLASANPQVLNPEDLDENRKPKVRSKTEIRDITHLHHALDACVIGFASHFLPRDGGIWELLLKRNLTVPEQETLLAVRHGLFARGNDGRVVLLDMPPGYKNQIRQYLAECRVVQHVPADMSGLLCDETVYRVYDPTDPHPSALRLAKWFARQKIDIPASTAETVLITCRKRRGGVGSESGKLLHESKTWRWTWQQVAKSALLGLQPKDETTAKLKPLKAVKILGDNFGLAILDKVTDPAERIVLLRHHKVWSQLAALRQRNGGQWPRILRIGVLVTVPNQTGGSDYRGVWMIRGVTLNQKAGYLVDMSSPDRIKYRIAGVRGCFQNVGLNTLLRDGLQPIDASFTGVKAIPVADNSSKLA